jgi:hypothetical protein
MEWGKIWRTVFCGWDGDVDLVALAEELRNDSPPGVGEDRDGAAWVCRQIQKAL